MMLSPPVLPVAPVPQTALIAGLLPPAIAGAVRDFAHRLGLGVVTLGAQAVDRAAIRRTVPALIVLGVDGHESEARALLAVLKRDDQLQTVPAVVAVCRGAVSDWFEAGADEVVSPLADADEVCARLEATVRRSRRDVQANPSTRLPGTDAIAAAIEVRLRAGDQFAACYADLDHFKEFNDRYGFAAGDGVIRSVAALLVEAVGDGAGADGFVGHIGGDDFLFLVPVGAVAPVCDAIVRRVDELLPARYGAHDRQAGYFFGKDRRGRLDRVPLMTLSIGVVTNVRRHFASAAQVSELATEMKTYCKTLPGSVWAMDRRSDGDSATPPEEKLQ